MTNSQETSVSELIQKAIDYFNTNDFDNAKRTFEDALNKDSKNERVLIYLGTIAWQENNFELALKYYKQVVEYAPNNVNALYNLGITYQKLGKLEEAVDPIEKVIKLKPSENVFFLHANIIKTFGRDKEALRDYQQILELNPNSIGALGNSGRIYEKFGQFKKALEMYERIVKIEPNNGKAYFDIVVMQERLEKFSDALENINKTIDLYRFNPNGIPDKKYLLSKKGNILRNLNNNKEALVYLQEALRLDPKLASTLFYMSEIYFNLHQYQDSLDFLDRLREIKAEDDSIVKLRLQALKKLNRKEDILTTIDYLLSTKPNDFNLILDKAQTLQSMEKYTDALAPLDKLLELNPYDTVVLRKKLEICKILKQSEQENILISQIQSIINKYPENGLDHDNAIVLKDINDFQATDRIYSILRDRYGLRGKDWFLIKQVLDDTEKGIFDKMIIELESGEQKTIYFNITDTFGKLD